MAFRLLKEGGYPLLAFPVSPRAARINSFDRINGFTAKRWGLKQALRVASAFGAHAFLSEHSVDPLLEYAGIASSDVCDMIANIQGVRPAALSIIWPWPTKAARSRVYLHAFDADGRPVTFVKIALTKDEVDKFSNESMVLASLEKIENVCIHVPKLLGTGILGTATYIAVEPLPLGLRSLGLFSRFPYSAAIHISGQIYYLTLSEVQLQPWWPSVAELMTRSAAAGEAVTEFLKVNALPVCRVHGDFSRKNLFHDSSGLWVVDWETSALAGPRLVDELAYLLHDLQRQVRQNPTRVWTKIKGMAELRGAGKPEIFLLLPTWPARLRLKQKPC
jgi:hypothetical protein